MSIEKILDKAKMGDKESLKELVQKFKPLVITRASSIYVKDYDIEDLIQIGFMSVIKAVNMYDAHKHKSFTAYVCCAVKQNFYYLIRQQSRHNYEMSLNKENGDGLESMDLITDHTDLEEDYIKKVLNTKLYACMDKLSAQDRELLLYNYFKNYTLKKYCALKNINYNTASQRKRRILKKLRDMLKKEW